MGGILMPVCLRCGERFKNNLDINLPICPKCREYEYARGFISCRSCNTLIESTEAIGGYCTDCHENLADELDDEFEMVSFEELQADEENDDFDE
jgi:Zn finger protein HypA/HybF involved in hydrogenase expression